MKVKFSHFNKRQRWLWKNVLGVRLLLNLEEGNYIKYRNKIKKKVSFSTAVSYNKLTVVPQAPRAFTETHLAPKYCLVKCIYIIHIMFVCLKIWIDLVHSRSFVCLSAVCCSNNQDSKNLEKKVQAIPRFLRSWPGIEFAFGIRLLIITLRADFNTKCIENIALKFSEDIKMLG